MKADTYVVETTVHFPTDLNLMWDSGRKCMSIIGHILGKCQLQNWREWRAWAKKLKRHYRASAEIHRKGGQRYRERLQSQVERQAFEGPTNCILCASCFSACPIPASTPAFLGPAAIVNANRFITDSRDRGFQERLPILDTPNGVWPCQNHFKCTQACPRWIQFTKRINQTKKMITKFRKGRGETVNDGE